MHNAHEITALAWASRWLVWFNNKRHTWVIIVRTTEARAEYCQALIEGICAERPDMKRHLLRIKLSLNPDEITGFRVEDLEEFIFPRQSMGRGTRVTKLPRTPVIVDYTGIKL